MAFEPASGSGGETENPGAPKSERHGTLGDALEMAQKPAPAEEERQAAAGEKFRLTFAGLNQEEQDMPCFS
jgi:hypothetical protein